MSRKNRACLAPGSTFASMAAIWAWLNGVKERASSTHSSTCSNRYTLNGMQFGHLRERSGWGLPWAADSHGGLLALQELQHNGAGQGTVQDGLFQSVQPSKL